MIGLGSVYLIELLIIGCLFCLLHCVSLLSKRYGVFVKNYVKATLLCIRFPFLYPRNRFTGNHYDCWLITDYINRNWKRAWVFEDEHTFEIRCTNRMLAIWLKFLEIVNDYILAFFHCLTDYTELDAMPEGWRKAFGIQMCKEIRSHLLKSGIRKLLSYRIIQIKEKNGYLHWYSNSDEYVDSIVSKYEDISMHTCIECGKKAKYRTFYSIYECPYCEDCIKPVMERRNAKEPLDISDSIDY